MYKKAELKLGLVIGVVAALLMGTTLRAQPLGSNNEPRSGQENSPYSRYGLGNMSHPYSTNYRGLGGAATAGTPNQSVNSYNPASYSFLGTATLDFSMEARHRNVFEDAGRRTSSGTADFGYFNLGSNVGKVVGFNLGFKPLARSYYNASDTFNSPGLGETINNFNGKGGLQLAFLGLSARYKGFSIGVNGGYAFGSYNKTTSLQFSGVDTAGEINRVRSSQVTGVQRIGGLYWEGGAMYQASLKNKKYLNIGLRAALSQELKVKDTRYTIGYNYLGAGSGAELIADTIHQTKGEGTLTMPQNYGFGLAFGKENNWEVAGDVSYTDWSEYQRMGDRSQVADNAWRVGLGASYTPNASTPDKSYLSYATYRIGGFYGKDYLQFGGQELNYYGGTFGMSLPLQRNYNNFGQINLALEVGQRGKNNPSNGLIRETFLNFTFGISLNDSYWLKRPARYN